jgi:hypothetical protein
VTGRWSEEDVRSEGCWLQASRERAGLDFAMLSASNAVVGDALALLLATISEVYCCYYVSFDEGHLHCFLTGI